jgi:hypothetical protein
MRVRFDPENPGWPLGLTDSRRDEWVVRFAFELPDEVACSTEMAIVLVDDATGEPRLLESL